MTGDSIREILPKLCFPYFALVRLLVVFVSNPSLCALLQTLLANEPI
jgi:hypothetical protein